MGWNARKFAPWMMMIFFIAGTVCVRFTTAQDSPFVVGIDKNPPKLDPQDQHDSESQKVIGQVCEGLYRYNYSSPEMEIIPQLANAIGYFEGNNLIGYNYTVSLREDVTFHDGTPFNASAVKWTFDRIQYSSYGLWKNGLLVAKAVILMESYSLFAISGIPILNETVIESEFVVRFVLNTGLGFFERLLAFMATQIMLPDPDYAWGNKFLSFLDLSDDLIGTGPYTLVDYINDYQVEFKAYEDYYLERPTGFIKNMIYRIESDFSLRCEAILNYQIHWGAVGGIYDEEFEEDPNLVEIPKLSSEVYYIQMNMENIPTSVRQASSFAYNYTHLVENRSESNVQYLHTPIPYGMLYHHEWDGQPYTNLTYARELILNTPDEGVGDFEDNVSASGLIITSSTQDWINVAESPNPLAWYNFTEIYQGLEAHYSQLAENMKAIGIRVDRIPWSCWTPYYEYLHDEVGNKKLSYSIGRWSPNFNDPINMIEPLYGRDSDGDPASGNCFLLNDPTLNNMINETYFTTDFTSPTCEELFHDIQKRIVSELVPSFYIYQGLGSISFNRLYVDENSITDMKNAYSVYYWYNVIFYPSGGYPRLEILSYVFLIVTLIGMIVTLGAVWRKTYAQIRTQKN